MNPIERLQGAIKAAFPRAAVTLTPPLDKEGSWFLDVAFGGRQLVVEWSPATSFGVSSLGNESYGERPDETYNSLDDVRRRITELLTGNEQTIPPPGVLLSRLRELRGCTQEEIASKLGVRQATVSGMERRHDIQFSTLRRVIEALSGSLEIFASFSDARYRLCPSWVDLSGEVQPLIAGYERAEDSARSPTYMGGLDYEETFKALHDSGALSRARRVGDEISSRGMVLEMAN